MTKNLITRLSAVCLTAMLFVFTGCQDKDYYDPEYLPPSTGAPSDVDFSTTRNVKLDFDKVLPSGLITAFNVYSENPYKKVNGVWVKHDDISPIASGINVAGVTNLKRTLPVYVSELYVCPTTLFASRLMHAKIDNNVATFAEMNLINDAPATTRTLAAKSVDHYLSPQLSYANGYYKPTVTMKKEPFPVAVKNAIAAAFKEGETADPKYYQDASIKILQEDKKDEGAELFLSVIHSNGSYDNSLMYFAYVGDKEIKDLNEEDMKKMHVISAFQFAKIGLTSEMQAGDYIQLKYFDGTGYVNRFPLEAKVGWVLSSNGFYKVAGNDNIFTCITRGQSKDNPWFYSIPSWNPEKNNKNHTISFTATHNDKNYICFGFEDMANEGSGKGDADCNDVMFHIISNPIKALDPPPYIPEEGTIEILENKAGILAFEDNWPRLGDYDLNDVVVRYDSEITYVQKTEDGKPVGDVTVSRTIDKYTIINDGATFLNGFSYKVGFNRTNVSSMKIDGESYEPTVDGDGFIVDLCPNVKICPLPKSYNVTTTYKPGINHEEFNGFKYGKAPYNPFITVTNPTLESKCIEVHLPFHPPTGRADMNLFGKFADCSNVADEVYYAVAKGVYYPFALHLAEVGHFRIPVEAEKIEYTYPRYTNWVNSGCGTVDCDWYLYPTP